MIRPQRKISVPTSCKRLVFGWLRIPKPLSTNWGEKLGVSKQGLDQRLDARAADCLWRVVRQASRQFFAASPVTIPRRGGSNCSDRRLHQSGPTGGTGPAVSRLRGSDPEAGQAGLKLLVRFEVTSGQFQALERSAARDSERTLSQLLPPLPQGSLHLADLGFFDLRRAGPTDSTGRLLD